MIAHVSVISYAKLKERNGDIWSTMAINSPFAHKATLYTGNNINGYRLLQFKKKLMKVLEIIEARLNFKVQNSFKEMACTPETPPTYPLSTPQH